MEEENQKSTPVIAWDVNKVAIAKVAEELKDVDAYQDLDGAKAAKKRLTKMRTALGEAHKETKADALAFGRKVDAKKNEYMALIKEIEDPISKDLDAIKNAAAIAEEARVNAIEAELFKIDELAVNRHELVLEDLQLRQQALREIPITEEIFQEMFETAQTHVQDVEMKLRIAVGQEEERLEAERVQRETAAENARKQKELDERQAKMDAEDAERQAARDKEDAERREKEAAEAAATKEKQDAIAAEQAEAQKKIDDENERLASEKAEAERQEREAKEYEEAQARALEQAPDREKLLTYADSVDELLKRKPTLSTDPANEIMLQAAAMLIEVAYDIRKSTEEMK